MFNLYELIEIVNGRPASISEDLTVKGVSTDTRTIKRGELFIALKGNNYNGNLFIDEAKQKGAPAAIVSDSLESAKDFPVVKVDDTQQALSDIALAYRLKFDIPLIAITGSNGKTTVKDMVSHILSKSFKVLSTERNFNNKIGVPKTLFRLRDHKIAVVEVGSSVAGEIAYNAEVLRPTVSIITNIGPSHLDSLKDKNGVLNEKMALVESLGRGGVWIKNVDDSLLALKNPKGIKIRSFGIESSDVDFRAEKVAWLKNGVEFDLVVRLEKSKRLSVKKVKLSVIGIHNIYNALAAIAASSLFVDVDKAVASLSSFSSTGMRFEVLDNKDLTIINDAYNSNPLSFEYAVSSLREFPRKGKKILVCADMLELGRFSNRFHFDSGQMVAKEGIDYLLTFGEKALDIADGAISSGMEKKKVKSFQDKKKLEGFLKDIIEKNDTILIKGSRSMKMEEIVDCFTTYSIR